MSKNNVVDLSGRDQFTDALTELLRTGARQLIQQAVEAELAEFMGQYKDQQLDNGRAAVVRNGYQPEREIQTGIGSVTVKIPKVRAKDGEADGVARIVLESVQELLLKLALQMTRDDYETRRERQRQGVQLARAAGK